MIAGINTMVDLQQAVVQRVDLPLPADKTLVVDVLRLDKIHATVSGNKWFKLKYALEEAISLHRSPIVTAGGAYSNHLAATAYACARLKIPCLGIIRGEKPATLSPTLADCSEWGMQFHFASREDFTDTGKLFLHLRQQLPHAYFIPEGGSSYLGVRGAAEILKLVPDNHRQNYSHICCAVGTGTMMAGLINASPEGQQVIGISVLKMAAGSNSVEQFIGEATGGRSNYTIVYDQHFGGYARQTPQLLKFMNLLYERTGIPTDFVYTGKLFYAIGQMAHAGKLPPDARVLIIHSGGLQGNRSLPENALFF